MKFRLLDIAHARSGDNWRRRNRYLSTLMPGEISLAGMGFVSLVLDLKVCRDRHEITAIWPEDSRSLASSRCISSFRGS